MGNVFEPWGKTHPIRSPVESHSVLCHLTDVASVVREILLKDRQLLARLAWISGMSESGVLAVVERMALIHDLGKFAARFQSKASEFFPPSYGLPQDRNLPFSHGQALHHLHLSGVVPALSMCFSGDDAAIERVIATAAGHHGSPPSDPSGNRRIWPVHVKACFGAVGLETCAEALEVLGIEEAVAVPDSDSCIAFTWVTAGLLTLADWIGSNRSFFPFEKVENQIDFESYRKLSAARAERAVAITGVIASKVQLVDLQQLTDGHPPRPMQKLAAEMPLPNHSAIYIIEDDTGSGKTEAAIMLASRLMNRGDAEGMYLALPTSATSNNMYARLAGSYRGMFEDEASPSLVLAHGSRSMNDGFRASVVRIADEEQSSLEPATIDDADESASGPTCSAYLADERRLTFLADVGVGTVDQAIMSVLPMRFQSLRMFGLSRRVLVIDELHCYDSYVGREIEQLVRFQGAFGAPVIVLSATLTRKRRTDIVEAYLGGAIQSKEPEGQDARYPLMTVATADGSVVFKGEDVDPGRRRKVLVRLTDDVEELLVVIREKISAGECVVWIRNTVGDAVDAFALLSDLSPLLFHSRFTQFDRAKVEMEVVSLFGRNSTEQQRRGRLLIATQVVEQSMDVDFDFMVTDLAPMDLVIQRAGRLRRHCRKWREGTLPEMLVLSPSPDADCGPGWYRSMFPRAAYVYRDHAVLWKTAQMLDSKGCIDNPDSLRPYVEHAYGEDGIPEALGRNRDKSHVLNHRHRSMASIRVLNVEDGYSHKGGSWESDVDYSTRLNDEPTTTIRLAFEQDGRLLPLTSNSAGYSSWTDSELKIPSRLLTPEEAAGSELALRTQLSWPVFDRKIPVLLCSPRDDESWVINDIRNKAGAPYSYSTKRGFLKP